LAEVLGFGAAAFAAEKDEAKPATAQGQPVAAEEAPWSEAVNGLQARIELKQDRMCDGTPSLATFLVLRNTRWSREAIKVAWAAERMEFKVVDAEGKELPQGFKGSIAYSGPGMPPPLDLAIPFKGTLSFDISGQGMGIAGDQVAAIDLGTEGCWVLSQEDGACSLRAVLDIPEDQHDKRANWQRAWHGRIELPPVPIPTVVAPLDPAVAGKLIAEWGAAMIKPTYGAQAQEAARKLSLVADPRVVPWYVKAMDSRDSTLKVEALGRLARYDGDEALAGVKKGLATQPADIANCPPELTASVADRVRNCAAIALVRSPQPEARSLLLTLWNDPVSGVRQTVLHTLGKTKTPEATALLRRMCEDPDDYIRGQAKVYLVEREADPAKPSDDGKKSEP
jgi:hypothetical protein